MNKIEWSDGLSVGVEAIDNDHKRLISIINRLFQEIDNNAPSDMLEAIFMELQEYTVYHFDHEEKLMYAQCSSFEDEAYIEAHVKQHQRFINDIPLLKQKLLNASSKELAVEVVEFLATWLLEHIVTEDLSFTEYLMKHKKIMEEMRPQNSFEKLITLLNNRIPLPKRAMLILLIPFITLILLSGFLTYDLYKKYENISGIAQVSKSFICINSITDNLQKERGLSSGYIFSSHQNFAKELQEQRDVSSQNLQECRDTLMRLYRYKDEETNALLDTFSKESLKLQEIREKVDYSDISNVSMMYYYTSLIGTLIDLVEQTRSMSKGDIYLQPSLLLLLHLKENSGLLRAEGASVLEQKEPDRQRFKELLVSSEAYKKVFGSLSPKEFTQAMQGIEVSANSLRVQEMQDAVLSGSAGVGAEVWFESISVKIDAYKELVLKIVTTIDESASAQRDEFIFYMKILWISLVLVLSLAFFISFALKESIVTPIETFTAAMVRLANGDKSYFNYTYQADDAVKEMISAFENFRRSLIRADLTEVLLEIKGHRADEYERLAYIDPLTNALNRRKFRELYEQEFNKAKQKNSSLCVLALDLDKFKKINDNYGHDIGDSVLKAFTEIVQKMIRPTDYLARVGGEEFLLLLCDTNEDRAIGIAKRICSKVEMMDLSEVHEELHLTVSIGIGYYKEESSMDSIIKDADENLYQAKADGRNRVNY